MISNILDLISILLMLCVLPTVWLVYKKKLNFLNGVFLGTFLFLVSSGCSMYAQSLLYGGSPADLIINNAFDTIMSAYSSVPGISEAEIQTMKQLTETLKEVYSILLPSVLVLGNLLWVYVIFMISKGILAVFRKDVSGFMKFSELKLPKTALFFSVLSYILSMIFKDNPISYAFFNFSVIIFMVSSVCGLSVLDYAFRKKIRFSLLRALVYVLAFIVIGLFTGMTGSLLVLIGITDTVFDFRKIKHK